MRKNTVKAAVLAAMVGTVLQFGCLGSGFLQKVLVEVAAETAAGFVDLDTLLGGLTGG